MAMLLVGVRYATNLTAMVARQQGVLAAAMVGSQFVATEAAKLPRAARRALQARSHPQPHREHPPLISDAIVDDLRAQGIEMRDYRIDVAGFRRHLAAVGYPANYAAGNLDEGGAREEKLLEYFVSLDLLDVRREDVIVDVASEYSIFAQVARRHTGATVYQQDLIYPAGVHGQRIGGSAAHIPVPDDFADKLVLHNAFEHFEGDADSDFIREAWRVLRPGGVLCILPLFMSDRFAVITDPLVDRTGVVWDAGTDVVEIPWWHVRFARLYDGAHLKQRVLDPGAQFRQVLYHVVNPREVHPRISLHFALMMFKDA
jgi:SAM-dependent methyltransferase